MGDKIHKRSVSRRSALGMLGVGATMVAAGSVITTKFAISGQAKVKIGTLLPYSGTYAWLGKSITNSLELRFAQAGGELGSGAID